MEIQGCTFFLEKMKIVEFSLNKKKENYLNGEIYPLRISFTLTSLYLGKTIWNPQ